jgi:hypothetical protein
MLRKSFSVLLALWLGWGLGWVEGWVEGWLLGYLGGVGEGLWGKGFGGLGRGKKIFDGIE